MTQTLVKGNIIGKNIAKARKKQGMHQVELAAAMCVENRINMERSTISQIERGLRAVKDIEILGFCKILKTTPNDLFDYD